MRKGAWHQFGDRSQKLALEQLQAGVGSGAIISPRDITRDLAIQYCPQYRDSGAEILFDPQYYVPDFTNNKLGTYPVSSLRASVSTLSAVSDVEIDNLSRNLEQSTRELQASGVIAPAVVYEAGRQDIVDLNSRLFSAAKRAGDNVGVPTYATAFLGRSITGSNETLSSAVSLITALASDGWYFGYEFEPERIPSNPEAVFRLLRTGLIFACTGKPVLHAFAGPMSILSFIFGARGAAVGHSQNLWHFSRGRWQVSNGQGGGGDAPPRFFSRTLWGTIIYPDESQQIPRQLMDRIFVQSPYSTHTARGISPWPRWDSNKHLVHIQCTEAASISNLQGPREAARHGMDLLGTAVATHRMIAEVGLNLRDESNAYQIHWLRAITRFLADCSNDLEYFDLIQ